MAVNKHLDMVTKSLDEIDELVKGFTAETDLSKASKDEDLSPDDVSDEAPAVDDGTEAPEPEEEPELTDEDTESTTDEEEDEDDVDVEKSLEGELNGNESVKKALEVSEFLQEMVKGLDAMVTDRTDRISKSIIETTDSSNELLAKSIIGIANAQKVVIESNMQILKSINATNDRITAMEAQPTVRKSVSNANQVQALDKSFNASAGSKVEKSVSLSKAQASTKLTLAYEAGNTDLMNDILALEGTGNLDAISEAGKQVLGL